MRFILALLLAWLLLLGSGCQQPYQVFAVQVAHAPAAGTAVPAPAPADPPSTARSATRWQRLRRSRPQALDLNRAPATSLRRLPGMDAATVAAILAGRPYRAKRELVKRNILTPAQYARWKGYLVVHRARRPG